MAARLTPVPLEDVEDEQQFGGKAVSLAHAIRAALPVPGGLALSAALVERIACGDTETLQALTGSPRLPKGRLAVRSSAIGEDSADASFAGQHVTRLNVFESTLGDAVRSVWESARSEAALGYRRKRGINGPPAIGVVVQALVEPLAAGVLFTRDPISGADERWVEAAWGLGEAVVSGIVSPDRYRLDRRGQVIERVVGCKDVKVWFHDEHGTAEMPVHHELHDVPCLTEQHLAELHALADRCCSVWGDALDLEWAVTPDAAVFLLQSRPITTLTV